MPNKEDTPFVIDFKQSSLSNYGTTATSTPTGTAGQAAGTPTTPATALGQSPGPGGSANNNTANLTVRNSTMYCLHGDKHVEVRDHCHRARSDGVDVTARKKLLIASALCLFFMICEIVGGVMSNSLAIATDAAHLLTDFASFMISLFAIWIAGRPRTQRMSFGWYRAEVIGALASVFMIWVITAILVWLAVERVITGQFEVDAKIMLITSGLAILVNVIMGVQLHVGGHGHSHFGGSGGHGHSHAGGDGHGHSHGDGKCKSVAIQDPTGLVAASSKASAGSTDVCPASPRGRLEDGVDSEAADLAGHGVGQRTFSYQNARQLSLESHPQTPATKRPEAEAAAHPQLPQHKPAMNMNVRAALIHVIGDIVQSIGVFAAALVIYFRPDWAIADPICTFVFSIIVLFTTFAIMKDALLVLMEGTPSYMEYSEVLRVLESIEGVQRVHNLRIWALSINKVALSVHLAIAPHADPKQILTKASTAVHMRYHFFETTFQIEEYTSEMDDCTQCIVPAP